MSYWHDINDHHHSMAGAVQLLGTYTKLQHPLSASSTHFALPAARSSTKQWLEAHTVNPPNIAARRCMVGINIPTALTVWHALESHAVGPIGLFAVLDTAVLSVGIPQQVLGQ